MRARWWSGLLVAAFFVGAGAGAGCTRGRTGVKGPAADGVRGLIVALRGDDPAPAYRLMSEQARQGVTYDQFVLAWKDSAAERRWQAQALEDGLRGDPDVGETASVGFGDGKVVHLRREGKAWRLDAALVARSRARSPREAIKVLADALERRDVASVLAILSARRRDGLARQVDGFFAGLSRHLAGEIELQGVDRAVLRWDDDGLQYRIVLVKEDSEWRVDDIHIREAPAAPDDGGDEESEDHEDRD